MGKIREIFITGLVLALVIVAIIFSFYAGIWYWEAVRPPCRRPSWDPSEYKNIGVDLKGGQMGDSYIDDTRPFPIQGDRPSSIPWWLAEEAYKEYLHLYGRHGSQTLERLAERGGFGRKELLELLRGKHIGI